MKLSQIGELSLLESIKKKFKTRSKDILVGIGDDAAVLKPESEALLLTSDMMVEGVHFDLSFITPYQLGSKLVSVNVSDIFAMGGTPKYLLLGMVMNKDTDEEVVDSLFKGVQDAMKRYKVSLVGGDLSASHEGMVLSATLIGYGKRYVKRSGAKKGDKIYVTGNLGDSACGLEVLKKMKKPIPFEIMGHRANGKGLKAESRQLSALGLSMNDIEPLLRKHLLPEAKNPVKFLKNLSAMIDISDGLLIDLSRLCDESKVGARIYEEKIPLSAELKRVAGILGISPMRLALSGGEDYELLFTAPPEKKIKAICIGEITASGRVIIDSSGREKRFSAEGYQHFGIQR
ncbi:MAG: thiamine-phosphate kinase [Nitrospira sp.]|nr:thiamine-phosphate kinase [Nitrospira sp.]